jgi:hypothetical protein
LRGPHCYLDYSGLASLLTSADLEEAPAAQQLRARIRDMPTLEILKRSLIIVLLLLLVSMPTTSPPGQPAVSEGPSGSKSQLLPEPGIDPASQQRVEIEKVQADIDKAKAEVLSWQICER